MATVRETIRAKLSDALEAAAIEVVDESDHHAGHGGWQEGGETHFRVEIVAPAFSGMSRVERHRLVNGLLKDELDGGVHALALKTLAPEEVG